MLDTVIEDTHMVEIFHNERLGPHEPGEGEGTSLSFALNPEEPDSELDLDISGH